VIVARSLLPSSAVAGIATSSVNTKLSPIPSGPLLPTEGVVPPFCNQLAWPAICGGQQFKARGPGL
jgi:hypothetical protein